MPKPEIGFARPSVRARAAWAFILAAIVLAMFGIELVRFIAVGELHLPGVQPALVGSDAIEALIVTLGVALFFAGWGSYLRRRLKPATEARKRPLGFDWYSRWGRGRDRPLK